MLLLQARVQKRARKKRDKKKMHKDLESAKNFIFNDDQFENKSTKKATPLSCLKMKQNVE
jgi:hypothetical protein